jgi:hypothetical protein
MKTSDFKISDFRVMAPDPVRDHDRVLDLICKCFWSYFDFQRHCRAGYFDDSFYDWPASTIGLVGEQIATHWGIWTYDMRIGRARVKTGGVGAVATDGNFRKHGLMARTATAGVARLRELGFDMTLLFGIDNFYHRFGYVHAWPHEVYVVALSDLPAAKPPRTTQFEPGSLPELEKLYNRENAAATGTAVRPTYRHNMHKGVLVGYQWKGSAARPGGYVTVNTKEGRVAELCGDIEAGLAVARLALGAACHKEARFQGWSAGSPLCRRLRRGNCRVESNYRGSGGAMIRTVNLRTTLEKMLPELSARLAGSAVASVRERLLIDNGEDRVTLVISRGKVALGDGGAGGATSAIVGDQHVSQLLIGTGLPQDVIADAGMKVRGRGLELAAALFPVQHPKLASWDGF